MPNSMETTKLIYRGESETLTRYSIEQRKKIMGSVRRVVVKIGSAVLTGEDGIDLNVIDRLTAEGSWLKAQGRELVLVTSGAISSGAKKMGLKKKPSTIPEKQAAAAAGQASLMKAYEDGFGRHGEKVAQVLLTRDDLSHRGRYLNACNTLFTLLRWDVIPIINENDTVMVEEIKFGDNDNLSAMITNLIQADLLINLTNLDSFFDGDPRHNPQARSISLVSFIDRKVERMATKEPGTEGRGGMYSKIQAAKKVGIAGVPMVIANGKKESILKTILEGKDEGTLFLARDQAMTSRKYWIAFTAKPVGTIILDQGACEAIMYKGKSLLCTGVKAVQGPFSLGAPVHCLDPSGHKVAVGLVNYSSGDLKKIAGLKSREIQVVLGHKCYDEVIHRDNLVILELDKIEDEGGGN
jgi:glutamate 5-kinase